MKRKTKMLWLFISVTLLFSNTILVHANSDDSGELLEKIYNEQKKDDGLDEEDIAIQEKLGALYQEITEQMLTKQHRKNYANEDVLDRYVDFYAGSYIENGKLIVCVTEQFKGEKKSSDFVNYRIVDISYNELAEEQEKIISDYEMLYQKYYSTKGAENELLKSFVGVGIDEQKNALVVDIINLTQNKKEMFKTLFESSDNVVFQDVEETPNDDGSYKLGRRICVVALKGTSLVTCDVSIGYRAYLNTSSGKKYGFATCGHAIMNSSDGNVYTDRSCNTIMGTIEKWQYSGSVDASFIELSNGNSIIMQTLYSGPSTNTNGGDVIKSNSVAQSVAQGATVYKVGSATFKTSAVIQSTNYACTVQNELTGISTRFTNLTKTSKFCESGDSGGLVYQNINGENIPVGLIKGSSSTYSLYVKAYEVMSQMGVVPY